VCCWALASWAMAACGARVSTDTPNDAGLDVSTGGLGGTGGVTGGTAGAAGNSGTAGTAGQGGTAGNGASGSGGMGGIGGASGDAGGGAGGASGKGGEGGMGGVSGAPPGGASGAGGSGNAGGASGTAGAAGASAGAGGTGACGTAGDGGSTFDGGKVSCVVDQDCPAVTGSAPPCPEALCVMGEGVHQCVTRVHPPYGSPCAGDPDSGTCCSDDAQCTNRPHGHCIPFSYGPSCFQNLQIPPPPPGNRCVYDACTSDFDCTDRPNGLCTADFPRTCIYGPCRTNDDCNRRAGGKCVLGLDCEWSVTRVAFCRYADDPCRTNTDCIPDSAGSMACAPNDDLHGTRCKNIGIPPP